MTNKGMHEDLEKLIPSERMPAFLGGSCACNIGEVLSASGSGFTKVLRQSRLSY